jgi:hypothetical protein
MAQDAKMLGEAVDEVVEVSERVCTRHPSRRAPSAYNTASWLAPGAETERLRNHGGALYCAVHRRREPHSSRRRLVVRD